MRAAVFYPIFMMTLTCAFFAFNMVFKGGVIEMDTRPLADTIVNQLAGDWEPVRLRGYAHPDFLKAMPEGEAMKQYTDALKKLGRVQSYETCLLQDELFSFQPSYKRATYLCPLKTDETDDLRIGMALHQDPGKRWQLIALTVESPMLKKPDVAPSQPQPQPETH